MECVGTEASVKSCWPDFMVEEGNASITCRRNSDLVQNKMWKLLI